MFGCVRQSSWAPRWGDLVNTCRLQQGCGESGVIWVIAAGRRLSRLTMGLIQSAIVRRPVIKCSFGSVNVGICLSLDLSICHDRHTPWRLPSPSASSHSYLRQIMWEHPIGEVVCFFSGSCLVGCQNQLMDKQVTTENHLLHIHGRLISYTIY